jgi:hypothetical protein
MSKTVVLLLALALLSTAPALPCVAAFGYTDTPKSAVDTIVNVDKIKVNTAYIVVTSPTVNLLSDVQSIVAEAGPVFLDIEGLIFNPTATSLTTCPYERAAPPPPGAVLANHDLRGTFQSNVDTFFSVNAALFQGTRKVYGLVLNSEANNRCVETWKLQTAASYVKNKLAQLPSSHTVYTVVGYALRNTPSIGGKPALSSNGFPVDAFGNVVPFPSLVDVIAYYPYDIYDPNIPTHPLNVNLESWTSLSHKLDLALAPGQKTMMVVKAYCDSNDPIEAAWSVSCPNSNSNLWEIGQAAQHWASYLSADPRNLFMIGFDWLISSPSQWGSQSLSPVWSFHRTILQGVNCTTP